MAADCVSPDGTTGFYIRLCRYPNQSTAWLWVFAFTPKRIYAFTDHYLPCSGDVSSVEEPDVIYAIQGGAAAVLRREGPRDNPSAAYVSVSVKAQLNPDPRHGMGTEDVHIEAVMHSRYLPQRPNPQRSEWLGKVEATFKLPDLNLRVHGFGHWHEQHGTSARWQSPFTYISLRGENLCLMALTSTTGSTGHVHSSAGSTTVSSFEIDPPADDRTFLLTLEDGSALEGTMNVVHRYSVQIYSIRQPRSLVTARVANEILSGCVNDLPSR